MKIIMYHYIQKYNSKFPNFRFLDFNNFKKQFNINFLEYFSKEVSFLNEMISDGLIEIKKDGIFLSEIGRDFVQNIMNVFDKYDPPNKSYGDRLLTIKKAKEDQAKIQQDV